MTSFSKLMCLLLAGVFVAGPYFAGARGFGLGTERDAKIMAALQAECPPEQRDAQGRCPRGLRSVHRRTFRGGSYGFGK